MMVSITRFYGHKIMKTPKPEYPEPDLTLLPEVQIAFNQEINQSAANSTPVQLRQAAYETQKAKTHPRPRRRSQASPAPIAHGQRAAPRRDTGRMGRRRPHGVRGNPRSRGRLRAAVENRTDADAALTLQFITEDGKGFKP